MATISRPELPHGDVPTRAKALRPDEAQTVLPFKGLPALLAHDLKTSLASISMNLEFAIAELGGAAATVASALEDCRQANTRAIRIVSDMAEAARLTAGECRPVLSEVCLGQLVERAVCDAASEAALRAIEIDLQHDTTPVLADPALLSRVLDRLLERSLRQARAGTRIDVRQTRGSLSIRSIIGPDGAQRVEPSLALFFAAAAMEALGGAAWEEATQTDVLVCHLTLAG